VPLAVSAGRDQGSPSPAAPARPAPGVTSGTTSALDPVGAASGTRGTARLRGFSLSVRTRGLPPAEDYQVWLYDPLSALKR
jgi:hypothetical protein